jgi:trimethylamine--corrinoid protein Co-methyltransferase
MSKSEPRKRTGGRRARSAAAPPARKPDYRQLRHPFSPQAVFSENEIDDIHATALRVLEELGIKVLLPEARKIYAKAGAKADEDMVFIGKDLVYAALQTAPKSIRLRGINPLRDQTYEEGALIFQAGAGCPNVSDKKRGRRPGDLNAYVETIKLQQHYDVIHLLGPSAEPQDVPAHLRHYAMIETQMSYADKPINVYARGQMQTHQSFEMIRLGFGLSDDEFEEGTWGITVINSNSPRMLDNPMAQGLIDFARHNQMSIITPFCLAGAMAPITISGALALQHAEALAAIVLVQMTRAGAPISYGGFASNVDMKSGSPAFGTPEHVKLQIGAGQLARHIGLPWRSAAGAASNMADAQGATETVNALWGGMMANATLNLHAAGWLEGGLTFGYEKFINDVEALQMLAELCVKPSGSEAEIGFDALADVDPGGHFFATQHTMDRYETAFYAPIVADLSNFGSWTENGAQSSDDRAVSIWEGDLKDYQRPTTGVDIPEKLATYIERGTKAGGAPPQE